MNNPPYASAQSVTTNPGDADVDDEWDASSFQQHLHGKRRRFHLHHETSQLMVQNDLQIARRNRLLIKSGYDVNQPFK